MWEAFRAAPGVNWIRFDRQFIGPAEAILPTIRQLEREAVVKAQKIGSLLEWAQWGDPDPIEEIPFPNSLRPYQRDGAAWLFNSLRRFGAALLADEMGLGKSAQALTAAAAFTPKRLLIVCPAIVRPKWLKKELPMWAPAIESTVLSYDQIRKAASLDPFDFGILDEIHYCSNPRAARSQAVATAILSQPSRPLLIGLSGTPMTAAPRDLFNPLDILFPGRFGIKPAFERRFCSGHLEEIPNLDRAVWKAEGATNSEELAARLSYLMLRRTKAEVGDQLPPHTRIAIDVEVPQRLRRSMDLSGLSGSLKSHIVEQLSALEGHKIKAAVELAKDLIASNSKPLILTLRKETAAKIGRDLGCPVVTGDDDVKSREARLQLASCGVATLQSVTTGIDLVNFDCCIFVGLDWIPSTILQGEARIHRIGQNSPTTAYYLVAPGTLDEVVKSRVIDRLDNFATIVGAGDEAELGKDLRGRESEDDILKSIVEDCGKEVPSG